jgi:hypothetical protein
MSLSPPRSRSWFTRPIVIFVLLVFIACLSLLRLVATSGQVKQSPLPGVTATVTGKFVYRKTFASGIDGTAPDNRCMFAHGGYQVQDGVICYARVADQSNATITVQVKQIGGDQGKYYGVVFRRTSAGNYYAFNIDSNGDWIAYRCVSDNCAKLVDGGQNQAIQTGVTTVNTLQVHMNGSHFDFLVNGVTVGSADDATFAKGKVGMGVDPNTTCVFNNLEVTV